MFSQHCRNCFSPVYQVLSHRVHAFVCLNYDDCPDFATLASESETIRVAYSAALGHPSLESDYPLWPLEANHPSHATNQTSVTQPRPELEQSTQQGSVAIPTIQRPIMRATHSESSNAQEDAREDPTLPKQPLSELMKTEDSDQMAEVTEFANRSVDRRRMEAQAAGKIKRPANAYILYRMTHQGRGSSPEIVGKIWAMETDEVKQVFGELAKRDRSLHEQAFPEYKYNPKPRRHN